MIEVSYDEHYKMAQACVQNSPYDLVRIDMALSLIHICR